MTIGRDSLSKPESVTVAVIEGGVPLLAEARETLPPSGELPHGVYIWQC